MIPNSDAATVVFGGKTIPQPPPGVKPIVKVKVGGRRSFFGGCYVYLMELPGRFKKIGNSVNPLKRRDELQEELGVPIIVVQARMFYSRGEAMAFENALHKKYAGQRIIPPPCARRGRRNTTSKLRCVTVRRI
jgi:hypothetical protein